MALDSTHIAATTSAIAAVIFSKALEKSGEHVGDAVYQRISGLIQMVREQFQQEGDLETFTETEEDPSEQNLSEFTNRLADFMVEDETFAEEIANSWLAVSKDNEFQKLLSVTDLEKVDWSDHPLSVQQFAEAEDIIIEEPIAQPLKIQPEEPESLAAE